MNRPVDVAVGVILRADGRFLLAQRPAGKPMAGYWEFPGGKLEPGEAVFDALVREFDEELGLHIVAAHPWAQRVFISGAASAANGTASPCRAKARTSVGSASPP